MRDIINNLRNDADRRKEMIGTTAPSHWLVTRTQKDWDKNEKEIIKTLYKAARILEATL